MLFYGADQKGNSLLIKFSHRGFKNVEVSLYLTFDGRLYVLPDYPDTTLLSSFNQEWATANLKIELLQAEQRWRIIYNGMLRNLSQGDKCSDENIEHVRLNFIFIANSIPLKWPEDWSPKLHSDVLAREQWRNPQWMNKIKQLDYTGTDYFGSLLGQVRYNDGLTSTLYLRGLHQHRWGKHESYEFKESVTLFGVMLYGSLCYLNASSTKQNFPRIQSGQFRDNKEDIRNIDSMGFTLSDFIGKELTNDSEYRTWFTADGEDYDILIKLGDSVTMYYGQPWNWKNEIIPVKLKFNGQPGVGLLQVCSSYSGPCPINAFQKLQYIQQFYAPVERNDYIIRFDDKKCQNENIVGGKAFSLAILISIKNKNFVIPNGFCITVFALELQLHTHKKLQKVIEDIEHVSVGKKDGDLQEYCNRAVQIIQSTPIVDGIRESILRAINELEAENRSDTPNRYAIRSSAVGEDSEETSAAGQNSTYLGIQGIDNIIQSVAMCWASLYSYQSVMYRKQHGMFVKATMGVCVQKMVNADAAGVMFTRHPTTGNPSNIVITANYGLGETVVSATVEPDTIVVHKSWDNKLTVKNSVSGSKQQKLLVSNNGVVTVDLNEQEKKEICISEDMTLRLAAIGVDLETLFGSARDIEWAIINQQIYLLQARPITTLYTWTEFEIMHELDTEVLNDIDMFTFANVGEVMPYPLSPLSISLFVKTINNLLNIRHHISNRSSLNITTMRCTMNYLNAFHRDVGKYISTLNKIADISFSGNVVVTPEIHKVALEKFGPATACRQLFQLYRMISDMFTVNIVEKTAKQVHQNFILNAENFHTTYSLYNEINNKYPVYAELLDHHLHTTAVSTAYKMFAILLLMKSYKDFVPDHFSDTAILLGSCNDIISGQVVIGIKKVIRYIRKSEIDEEFKKLDPTKAIQWLKVNCPPAAIEVENILREHGHRCVQELDFFSESWSLKPENLIVTLQTMISSPNTNVTKKALNPEETVALLKTPKSRIIKLILKKLIPLSRRAIVQRELTKSLLSSITHKFKLAYRRLGKLMVLEEYLPSEDLIFFLTNEELGEILSHRNISSVARAFRRRKIYHHVKQLRYPELGTGMPIPIQDDTNVDRFLAADGSIKIQGVTVCGGSVLNRACVITDLSDAHKIQSGDILITHATDIAWSPYFALLSGIVTELGGLISHGAVVAREYGLPCIIAAKKATQLFRTGDTVLLIADSGILQLVKKCDSEEEMKIHN
ncbi:rifampicin phosphotransferase-like isoform X2 [Nomia melanderi]